jgi:hypothetical protein
VDTPAANSVISAYSDALVTALIKPALALVASLMLLLIPAAATADPGDVQTAWRDQRECRLNQRDPK